MAVFVVDNEGNLLRLLGLIAQRQTAKLQQQRA
jgi:hypothetical protein